MSTIRRMCVCAVAMFAAASVAAPQAADISWHPSWSRAIIAAQRSGRPILANVYTLRSPVHDEFAATTLRDPQVVAAAAEFECVRLNWQSPLPWPEARETQTAKDEKDAPLVVLCRPGGTAFYITFGALKPDRFLYYVGEAKRLWQMEQEASALETRYHGNPPTPETRFQLGRWYMLRGGADLRSILAAAFGGADGLVGAFVGEMGKQMSLGGMTPSGGPGADAPGPISPAPGEGQLPPIAMGLWVGMEQDEQKAKALRAKGAGLLGLVRRQDPNNRLGYADQIDLLLMQDAMIAERQEEAGELARRYVQQNPEGEGGALAYLVQAMASLSNMEQKSNAPPDFSEAKQLLDKAMAAPGDDGSKMLAGMMRVVFEMMEALIQGFVEAFKDMGAQMEQAVQPK